MVCIFSSKEHTKVINALIEHGAVINAQNNTGMTLLHCAVDRNQTKAIHALIHQGADIAIINKDGQTSWMDFVHELGCCSSAYSCYN